MSQQPEPNTNDSQTLRGILLQLARMADSLEALVEMAQTDEEANRRERGDYGGFTGDIDSS